MYFKSPSDLKRIVYTIWSSLRTLKQNEQIYQIFNKTFLWRNEDLLYIQSSRPAVRSPIQKKRKKKTLVKTGTVYNCLINKCVTVRRFDLFLHTINLKETRSFFTRKH
jgi:hypothetical protein